MIWFALVALGWIEPECGPVMTQVLVEISHYPESAINQTTQACVHLWPEGGYALPRVIHSEFRVSKTQAPRLAFTIPPARGAYMWFVSEGPCKRASGQPALIRKPGLSVVSHAFHLYEDFLYMKTTPAKIGLSSDKSLLLEGSFPHIEPQRSEIKVWFIGKTHNKTREAKLIKPGRLLQVAAPTWPAAEKVELRLEWCGGELLSHGHGHIEFATEDTLFGKVAANVKEEEEDNDQAHKDLDTHDHKTINMVESYDNVFFDPEHNEFVKSRSGDRTKLDLDVTFMQGIILLTICSALCGSVLTTLIPGFPSSLGHILGGIIVGPGGFDVIEELIQVETLAEFGVIFMLFELGMHFSAEKVMAAIRAALGGGVLLTLTLVILNMCLSLLTATKVQEGLLFGLFASLSSTALTSQVSTDSNLVAILIVQDVMLALFLACVPKILGVKKEEHSMWTPHLAKFVVGIIIFKLVAVCLGIFAEWRPEKRMTAEVAQALTVAWVMMVSYTSELAGLSFELGAFVAGFTLPVKGDNPAEIIGPLRSFFGVLFFGSIGLVVRPRFLWDNTFAVLSVAMWLLISKLFAGFLCLTMCGIQRKEATVLSLRLAHVGEFGFVFASKGRSWGVLTRHVYLLLVGATAISIASAPILFKFAEKEFSFLDIGVRKHAPTNIEMQRLSVAQARMNKKLSDATSSTLQAEKPFEVAIGNELQSHLDLNEDLSSDGTPDFAGIQKIGISRVKSSDEV